MTAGRGGLGEGFKRVTDTLTAPSSPGSRSFMDRYYFLLRRLHSLSGVVPIGVFLLFHLTTNGSVLWGMLDGRKKIYAPASGSVLSAQGIATFQHEVDFIHSTPFLLLVEVLGLWLPIAFHATLGVYYATTGKSNLSRYAYQDNWRYTLQRATGYIALVFILWHVATMRWGWTALIPGNWFLHARQATIAWNGEHAGSTMAWVMQGSKEGMTVGGLITTVAYLLGTSASVFHFANGLWTAAITWGLTISEKSQKSWGRVCAGVGAGLMVLGLGAAVKFATLDYEHARQTELNLKLVDRAEGAGVETVKPGGSIR